jgi:hypothetical protein
MMAYFEKVGEMGDPTEANELPRLCSRLTII